MLDLIKFDDMSHLGVVQATQGHIQELRALSLLFEIQKLVQC